jgi:hypothetical protein
VAEDKNTKKKQASKNGKNEDKKGGKREGGKKKKKKEKGRYREGVIVGTHSRGASGVVDRCRELNPLVA